MIRQTTAIFFSLLILSTVQAKEFLYLGRSPKALLMGDAFTANATDEYTLFYNPAALARTKGMNLTIINPDFGITNALDEMDRFEDFPSSDPAAIADRFLGLPVFVHAGIFPTLKFGGFGFTLFASSTTSLVMRNAIHPVLDVDYRLDRGFVMGYAFTLGSEMHQTSIGISVKNINRQGLDKSFSLFGVGLLNTINSQDASSYAELRDALGYSKGKGWGGDIGIEHFWRIGSGELIFAASVLDVGNTRFRRVQGIGEVPMQEMYVNTGMTWRQDFMLLDYSISLDIHPVLQDTAFGRKVHLGFEVGIPALRIMAGINAGYVAYGVSTELWPFKLTAGFYSVELGSEFKQEKGSRALIYLSLFDFSFDAF